MAAVALSHERLEIYRIKNITGTRFARFPGSPRRSQPESHEAFAARAELTSTARSGDDRRHAIGRLVGHGGSHRANHMSQPRMPAPTGIARHILALQLTTPVSEALSDRPRRSQYSRCVSPFSRHASKCPRHNALTASRSCNRSRPIPPSSSMTSGQDKIAPPQLTISRAKNGRSRSFPDLAENFPDTPI
jgi:hypothetical protein